MNYFKPFCLFIIIGGIFNAKVFSHNFGTNKVTAPPTASNFAYPQSVFIDSPNGQIWVTDFDNHRALRFDVSTLTSIIELEKISQPTNIFLSQNYPNPFNGGTQITFLTNITGNAVLSVYNILGQKIITLFNQIAIANTVYSVAFNADYIPSGIYLYSLSTDNGIEFKRMCLLK